MAWLWVSIGPADIVYQEGCADLKKGWKHDGGVLQRGRHLRSNIGLVFLPGAQKNNMWRWRRPPILTTLESWMLIASRSSGSPRDAQHASQDCVQGSYYMRNLRQNQYGCSPRAFPCLARIIDAEFFLDWFFMKFVTRYFLGKGCPDPRGRGDCAGHIDFVERLRRPNFCSNGEDNAARHAHVENDGAFVAWRATRKSCPLQRAVLASVRFRSA